MRYSLSVVCWKYNGNGKSSRLLRPLLVCDTFAYFVTMTQMNMLYYPHCQQRKEQHGE